MGSRPQEMVIVQKGTSRSLVGPSPHDDLVPRAYGIPHMHSARDSGDPSRALSTVASRTDVRANRARALGLLEQLQEYSQSRAVSNP